MTYEHFWIIIFYIGIYTHNLLKKNNNIVKNPRTNTDKVLTFKFDNSSINCDIKVNNINFKIGYAELKFSMLSDEDNTC